MAFESATALGSSLTFTTLCWKLCDIVFQLENWMLACFLAGFWWREVVIIVAFFIHLLCSSINISCKWNYQIHMDYFSFKMLDSWLDFPLFIHGWFACGIVRKQQKVQQWLPVVIKKLFLNFDIPVITVPLCCLQPPKLTSSIKWPFLCLPIHP